VSEEGNRPPAHPAFTAPSEYVDHAAGDPFAAHRPRAGAAVPTGNRQSLPPVSLGPCSHHHPGPRAHRRCAYTGHPAHTRGKYAGQAHTGGGACTSLGRAGGVQIPVSRPVASCGGPGPVGRHRAANTYGTTGRCGRRSAAVGANQPPAGRGGRLDGLDRRFGTGVIADIGRALEGVYREPVVVGWAAWRARAGVGGVVGAVADLSDARRNRGLGQLGGWPGCGRRRPKAR
jgi:hypothetical protein